VATSTLFHSGIPPKKAAFMALTARYLSGTEADRLGLVSLCAPEAELEGVVNGIARQIASHQLAALQHHKIAVQMGGDLSLADALRIDQLVGERQARAVDPTGDVDGWLKSRKR
jgi:enoyl-CoA hydratase/carnithine racemase